MSQQHTSIAMGAICIHALQGREEAEESVSSFPLGTCETTSGELCRFGAPQYKKYMDMLERVTKMFGGWSTRSRRGEGTGLFSLKKQRAKEIKSLSTTNYGGAHRGDGSRLSSA